MDAQVLQVALGDQAADGVGHAADAQLEAGTVGDLGDDEVGHGQIHLRGGAGCCHLAQRGIVALHNGSDLVNVDAVLEAAQAAGHVLVHFHNDLLGLLADGSQMAGGRAEVEVAVLVHGGNLEHCHIHGVIALPVVPGQLGIADGSIEGEALGHSLPLDAAHVPAVPGHVGSGVLDLEDGGGPHQDAAAEIHILQLGQAFGEGGIHSNRGIHGPAVIHPVAALDHGSCSVGGDELALIFRLVVHSKIILSW